MIRAADAAAILGLGTEVVEQWLTDGKLHGSRSADGNWLVCTTSIRRMSGMT
jgi:predicted site-specific integrase-resolvase